MRPSVPSETGEPISFAQAFDLINPHLYTVEERIRAQARAFDPAVEGYVSYVCNAGGKRLRPALALLSAGATGKITSSHVDLAVILELIHIATLVHDDIMDGAELRRDQPSANAKWGNAITVLLGDCLFAHALRLSTGFSNSEICRRIADAAAEVCSGEIIQTQRRFDLKLSTADYYRIIEMKTAALFSAACELSAFISEASPAVISALKVFGSKLGIAYQIYDDLLDLAGSEEETGKTLGTDLRKGKFTLPVLLMLQGGKDVSSIRDLLLNAESLDPSVLAGMLDRAGAMQSAVATARRFIEEAEVQLTPIQDNKYARGLRGISSHLSGLLDRF
ncbi:MAG: polyprenyl synthetase family protein [Terrimicrobiaceae bacterium]|nr:polyprenyl synthetase family protein [Terrimicrobiaceae bacterium]